MGLWDNIVFARFRGVVVDRTGETVKIVANRG